MKQFPDDTIVRIVMILFIKHSERAASKWVWKTLGNRVRRSRDYHIVSNGRGDLWSATASIHAARMVLAFAMPHDW